MRLRKELKSLNENINEKYGTGIDGPINPILWTIGKIKDIAKQAKTLSMLNNWRLNHNYGFISVDNFSEEFKALYFKA